MLGFNIIYIVHCYFIFSILNVYFTLNPANLAAKSIYAYVYLSLTKRLAFRDLLVV